VKDLDKLFLKKKRKEKNFRGLFTIGFSLASTGMGR
jgi:hypothetical protein